MLIANPQYKSAGMLAQEDWSKSSKTDRRIILVSLAIGFILTVGTMVPALVLPYGSGGWDMTAIVLGIFSVPVVTKIARVLNASYEFRAWRNERNIARGRTVLVPTVIAEQMTKSREHHQVKTRVRVLLQDNWQQFSAMRHLATVHDDKRANATTKEHYRAKIRELADAICSDAQFVQNAIESDRTSSYQTEVKIFNQVAQEALGPKED